MKIFDIAMREINRDKLNRQAVLGFDKIELCLLLETVGLEISIVEHNLRAKRDDEFNRARLLTLRTIKTALIEVYQKL